MMIKGIVLTSAVVLLAGWEKTTGPEPMDGVTTDHQGAFHATVSNWGTSYTVCARVRVTPNAAFTPDTVDQPSVRMHYQTPDTVRIVITLQDR